MKITEVVVVRVTGEWDAPAWPPGSRQAQPLDVYPEHNAHDWTAGRAGGRQRMQADYVEVRTDEGITGRFGPIDGEQVDVIRRSLASFLVGRDPLANELLLDTMLRMHRHGRSGLFMTGVSALDCALWDLKGHAWGQPLYRLLGGPTRDAVPAYASMLGFSVDPSAAAEVALRYKAMGFAAQKWFFRHGPGDGADGMRRNLTLVAALREAVGDHYPLMVDAFMGWDLAYASEMLSGLEPYGLRWMEEPVPPERGSVFARLAKASNVPLATGEHVYTRWQVKELLDTGAIAVMQADPDWCGGVTELVKIASICSAYGIPLVAHGHSLLAALHVAASQSSETVPMVEYLVQHQPYKQALHDPSYAPVGGAIALPALPGLGIHLDDARILTREELAQ